MIIRVRKTRFGEDIQAAMPAEPSTGGPTAPGLQVINSRHPCYTEMIDSWKKFRATWEGGKNFVDAYLKTYSLRERVNDFATRKEMSYCPAKAKGSITRIKNAIVQRFSDITRKGGPKSYTDACNGDKWGVDKCGSSMNTFIANQVVDELLNLSKVGVYIDKPEIPSNPSQLDVIGKRPYIYTYRAEDILSWVPDESAEPNQYKMVLLREKTIDTDQFGLPKGMTERYRLVRKIATNTIQVEFFNGAGQTIDKDNALSSRKYVLNLPSIPFAMGQISQSLMTDIADMQIALLNLASSDMSYAILANFPFYIEQYDPIWNGGPQKGVVQPSQSAEVGSVTGVTQHPRTRNSAQSEIDVGVMKGRRYTKGLVPPGFIHPSPEPLKVSMEKQKQIDSDIEQIVNLQMANITAGSVAVDEQNKNEGLEAGLHNIGVELEHLERQIAQIWSYYEASTETITITYPKTYTIKSDKQRREEAKEIDELKSSIPSRSYQKEMAKQSAQVLLQDKIPAATLAMIFKEIDDAKTMTSDWQQIASDVELGLVGPDTASEARGYEKGEADKGQQAMAERLKIISEAQAAGGGNQPARGNPDGGPIPKLQGKLEKKGLPQRGDGK